MDSPAFRRLTYTLLITIAVAMAAGRVVSAQRIYEPSIYRSNPIPVEDPRPVWPAQKPALTATFSSNDRSRWATVRALVDEGTFIIGRRDRDLTVDSAVSALASADVLQFVTLSQAGYQVRVGSDRGIIFEDGWQALDKVLKPDTLEFYSSKPPLLPMMLAGEYWLLQKAFGWTLKDDLNTVVRTIVLTISVLPLAIYLVLLIRLADRFGATDWGKLFVVSVAAFGTQVTPFLITLNNHTIATFSVLVALYATIRIWEGARRPAGYFILAGFFAGFTACNELPATAFTAGLFVALLWRDPWRTLLLFLPFAVLPIAGLLRANYLAIGQLLPAYSEFGGPWYEYEGSHWRQTPGHLRRGIDFAGQKEDKATYAFHLLLGHHGLFSLTPVFLLGAAGMAWGIAKLPSIKDESPSLSGGREPPEKTLRGLTPPVRIWCLLSLFTLLVSTVVIGFYIVRTQNYGGWTNGPRWLMWLTPLWLLCMLPVADRLGARRWGRALALVLLALSVLSASYQLWNPWRHPWIYNLMDAQGGIPY